MKCPLTNIDELKTGTSCTTIHFLGLKSEGHSSRMDLELLQADLIPERTEDFRNILYLCIYVSPLLQQIMGLMRFWFPAISD